MMRKLWTPIILLLSLGLLAGCRDPLNPKNGAEEEDVELKNTYLYVNTFARNVMHLYYLWNSEIRDDIDAWTETEDPIAKVADIRYHSGSGTSRVDIDRWTKLYDDFSAFYGTVTGNRKTFGLDITPANYDGKVACAVVRYTYADSPARKTGLKRGDVIYKVNGKTLPMERRDGGLYLSAEATRIIREELMTGDRLTVELDDGTKYTLDAVDMYEDPILLSKVFDCDGKKVGYLFFTSFTLEACEELIDVAKEFKAEGVSELILDLRYNGGGFVITEEVLASLLAPEAEVLGGSVLSTEVFNNEITNYYTEKGIDSNTYLKTEFAYNTGEKDERAFSTAGANIGITKLYAIIESSTASASEAILCDLFPYLDITLVGQKTHGKYTSGLMMEGPDFYEDYKDQLNDDVLVRRGKKYTENWGLYVMFSRFADKDGQTRCMPDGLTPDVKVSDALQDGWELGDPNETMLAATLGLAGYKAKAPAARKATAGRRLPAEPVEGVESFRPEFGMRIKLHE